jgi:hypothetical protein
MLFDGTPGPKGRTTTATSIGMPILPSTLPTITFASSSGPVTAVLLRSPSPSDPMKAPLKEKFVSIFETFFFSRPQLQNLATQKGIYSETGDWPLELEVIGIDKEAFWNDLFMLKVNGPFIERGFRTLSEETLKTSVRFSISRLFRRCIHALRDENPNRVQHAAEVSRMR